MTRWSEGICLHWLHPTSDRGPPDELPLRSALRAGVTGLAEQRVEEEEEAEKVEPNRESGHVSPRNQGVHQGEDGGLRGGRTIHTLANALILGAFTTTLRLGPRDPFLPRRGGEDVVPPRGQPGGGGRGARPHC